MNEWLSQRFIEVFFRHIAMDEDRREFWLDYARHVSRFEVHTTSANRRRLLVDDTIRDYVPERCFVVDGNKSVFVMQIRDRIFVEYDQTGNACYIYKEHSSIAPGFGRRRRHADEFKRPGSMQIISYGRWHLDEGRIIHSRGWQSVLRQWFRKNMGIE